MIAKFYGKNYSLQGIRKRAFISREGVSMLGISDAAESIGFRTRGYRLRWEQLRDEVPLSWLGAGGKEQGAGSEGLWAKGKEQSTITDQLLDKNVVSL
jgi:hypothetical protein